mmetsp:Transcript_35528/g.77786  ORF Transcript_35528/g.77786 Transcript_35528/m.77786 type:complete len:203 (-) Transcript_35528:1156-1764(-)
MRRKSTLQPMAAAATATAVSRHHVGLKVRHIGSHVGRRVVSRRHRPPDFPLRPCGHGLGRPRGLLKAHRSHRSSAVAADGAVPAAAARAGPRRLRCLASIRNRRLRRVRRMRHHALTLETPHPLSPRLLVGRTKVAEGAIVATDTALAMEEGARLAEAGLVLAAANGASYAIRHLSVLRHIIRLVLKCLPWLMGALRPVRRR